MHQYKSVEETTNETADWREQFKKRPVACSLGAAAGGFVIGYVIAAMMNRQGDEHHGVKRSRPGLLERLQVTEAYDLLHREAAAVGKQFVCELTQTAEEVILPVAIAGIRAWLGGLLVEKNETTDSR